jgi:hypothetical protein
MRDEVSIRMGELAEPIEKQIMMCDSREELLMMACVMLQRTKEIFDQELTVEGRKKMFKDFV